MKENVSEQELKEMIENILNDKETENVINSNEYVDEKAASFLQSLKDMVK